MQQNKHRPPLVLIASNEEWSARSLESILGPNGYAVLKAYTGEQALARARSAQPDAIVLDATLPEMSGLEVCRQLRDHPMVGHVPVLITSASRPTRQQRLDAFEAGAWDFLGQPIDAEELALRLNVFIRAKREADRAQQESLLDHFTGLYNIRGLARRARELGSEAYRHQDSLACVVIAPDLDQHDPDLGDTDSVVLEVVRRLAGVFKTRGRVSDAIGRLGQTEFAVIAAGTDPVSAVKLAERLCGAIEQPSSDEEGSIVPMRARAGYYAVPNFWEAGIDPVDMLVRATTALRMAKAEGSEERIRAFKHHTTLS